MFKWKMYLKEYIFSKTELIIKMMCHSLCKVEIYQRFPYTSFSDSLVFWKFWECCRAGGQKKTQSKVLLIRVLYSAWPNQLSLSNMQFNRGKWEDLKAISRECVTEPYFKKGIPMSLAPGILWSVSFSTISFWYSFYSIMKQPTFGIYLLMHLENNFEDHILFLPRSHPEKQHF